MVGQGAQGGGAADVRPRRRARLGAYPDVPVALWIPTGAASHAKGDQSVSGGGHSTTTQQPQVPPEFKPLYRETGLRAQQVQDVAMPTLLQSLQPHAQRVAGLSAGEQRAISEAPRLGEMAGRSAIPLTAQERTAQERAGGLYDLNRMEALAQQQAPTLFDMPSRVSGAGIQESPSFKAAQQAFEDTMAKDIENRAALAGLGRSTALTSGLSAGRAQYMAPLIEAELGREERGLDRATAQRQAAIQTAAGLGGAERQALTGAIGTGTALGAAERQAQAEDISRETGLRLADIDTAMKTGALERGISQAEA